MPRTRITAKTIWTGDATRPFAKSITMDGGKIVGIDDASAVDHEMDGGEFICPAFIDSHVHLLLGGRALSQAHLAGVSSREEFERVIRVKHESLPNDVWLEASGWDQGNWQEHSQQNESLNAKMNAQNQTQSKTQTQIHAQKNSGDGMPDHTWLASCGNRPAIAWRMDQHVCVVNRAALNMIAQRHDLSRDPVGGTIARDASGNPTGLLLEQAAWKLAIPCVPEPNSAALRQAAHAAARHLHAHGIATVGSMEYSRDIISTLSPLRHELNLRIRATILDREWPVDWSLGQCVAADDALRIIGFKSFIDGTLGSRTARMLEPYCDAPDNSGMFVELAESGKLSDWLREGLSRGWSMSMHAIGDAALRAALDAADAAESLSATNVRANEMYVHAPSHNAGKISAANSTHINPARESLRIEHGQTAHASDVARCKERWLSMQPLHKYFDAAPALTRLCPARMDRFFSFKQFHESGARLAFGSDWPIVEPDCLQAMQTAITGATSGGAITRPDASITAEIALKAFTCNAAQCLRASDTCGTLKVGHAADVVSLDRNPLTMDWSKHKPNIRFTCVAGLNTSAAC
jgi:predicted amidohydrolase YtcJ